jgi:hypothetical protein
MWKQGVRACDREGDVSGPSVDCDHARMRKVKFQVRGREGNTYMLMSHFTGSGDAGAAASRCHGRSGGYNNLWVSVAAALEPELAESRAGS